MTARKNSEAGESATYKTMLDEVEQIVRDIQAPDHDLDLLVEKIERGYLLIQKMRNRLDETRIKVEKLRESQVTQA